jgi:hypothetical protein
MTKTEIKEIAKEVYKEEQEYQQLFKTMLNKTGKDINSMSDSDKKVFFNAVDKAYNAKSEGKLTGYKQSMNEDFLTAILTNPIAFLIIGKFIWYFLKEMIGQGFRSTFSEQYKDALDYIFKSLANNKQFSDDVAKIINTSKNFGSAEAEKIVNLPIVVKLAKEAEKINDKNQKKNNKIAGITQKTIQNEMKLTLLKAWKDNTIKNTIIDKIKKDIK